MEVSCNVFIPSKDRPMQLWGLLESFPGGNFFTNVLYKASDPSFQAGYEAVAKRFSHVNFIPQENKSLIDEYIYLTSDPAHKYVLLSTDDCLFYREIRPSLVEIDELFEEQELLSFSFRLGYNTVVQDLYGHLQPCLRNEKVIQKRNDYIVWDFTKYHFLHNYGYPLGMDGVMVRTDDIRGLHAVKDKWLSLRDWEGLLNDAPVRRQLTKKKMGAYKQSSLVNIPANMIQDPPIPIGYSCRMDGRLLNEMFLAGKRIDIKETFRNIPIHGCHQEVSLRFKDA